MAMTKCPDCGSDVSDKAPACPKCGCPIAGPPSNEANLIHCPKCGSTQIQGTEKGYGAGKAAVGVVLTGGVGLLAGLHGSKRVKVNCLNCGHSWIPAKEAAKAKKGRGTKLGCLLAILLAVLGAVIANREAPPPPTPIPAPVALTVDQVIAGSKNTVDKAVLFEAPIDEIALAKNESENTLILFAGSKASALCVVEGRAAWTGYAVGDRCRVRAVNLGVMPTSTNGSIALEKCELVKIKPPAPKDGQSAP